MTDLRRVYAEIPDDYETVNRVISLGMAGGWRRRMVRHAKKAPGGRWLDMCTGTGETAILLARTAPAGTRIIAADFSPDMLHRLTVKPPASDIPQTLADAIELPFPAGCFQLITTSFATRNLEEVPGGLNRVFREFYRVLAPGGLYVSIESSRPSHPVIDGLFRFFVAQVVERTGRWISGAGRGYAYLSHSIRTFHGPERLAAMMQEAGFSRVTWHRVCLGAAAIHIAGRGDESER
ncbi:ubiquinone/menaquinone biosynthesis methyltransferase [bacterium]|nr:ubiquinone/menaquinone biosynthesis methyltransferase [candidate division CSSED10-310 bacterium]